MTAVGGKHGQKTQLFLNLQSQKDFPVIHPTDALESTYQQLQAMKLDKSPFVVVSVIGQELLTHGFPEASVVVLEAGLKIGTCSLKLRGSVFSALSSAYWSLGNVEKSMAYMQQDLEVTKALGTEDRTGGREGGRLDPSTISGFHPQVTSQVNAALMGTSDLPSSPKVIIEKLWPITETSWFWP